MSKIPILVLREPWNLWNCTDKSESMSFRVSMDLVISAAACIDEEMSSACCSEPWSFFPFFDASGVGMTRSICVDARRCPTSCAWACRATWSAKSKLLVHCASTASRSLNVSWLRHLKKTWQSRPEKWISSEKRQTQRNICTTAAARCTGRDLSPSAAFICFTISLPTASVIARFAVVRDIPMRWAHGNGV